MMNVYGRVTANGWNGSRDMEALARYVRWEYGPGTGVGFLFAEAAAAGPARGPKRIEGAIQAIRAAVRGLRAKRLQTVPGATDKATRADG